MPAQIAGTTFISVNRVIERAGEMTTRIQRDGVDGFAAKKKGQQSGRVNIIAKIDRTSQAAATTLVKAMKLLQGTVIEIEDDLGETFSNIYVWRVRLNKPTRKGITAVGGTSGGGVLVELVFEAEDRDLVA